MTTISAFAPLPRGVGRIEMKRMSRPPLVGYAFLGEPADAQPMPEPSRARPKGKRAFGYRPEQWPQPSAFWEPVTPTQIKMSSVKARERSIPDQDLPVVRTLVLNAYGVGDANSKGNASLFVDWLMNASEDAIDAAIQSATAPEQLEDQYSLLEQGLG
jgi:hypothetical protein